MKVGEALTIFSQMINFAIFIYFVVTLLKINFLNTFGLLVSAFGLLSSLVASIVSAIEVKHD